MDAIRRACLGIGLLGLWSGIAPASAADEQALRLLIQPIQSETQSRHAYAPLATYIGQALRREVALVMPPNPIAYWALVRRGEGFEFTLDEAHFTDYRVERHGFDVLAKTPDSMSFSLVVRAPHAVQEPTDLVGKRVATLGLPSLGAMRLTAMFTNPSRQPHLVEITDVDDALAFIEQNRADAAILPTDLVRSHMARGAKLKVVTTTEPVPSLAFSAAPALEPEVREHVRQLLLNAQRSPDGREMLNAAGIARFEAASAETYAGHARALQRYWGY